MFKTAIIAKIVKAIPTTYQQHAPTVIQPIYCTGSSKSSQELCQHVYWELLYRQLSQNHHGQRDGRVHMSSWTSASNILIRRNKNSRLTCMAQGYTNYKNLTPAL